MYKDGVAQVEQSTSINGSQNAQKGRCLRNPEINESACRRFSIARSNPKLNAEGYGIQQEIRDEAKEIQNELTDPELDDWGGDLVAVVEEIDSTNVAGRRWGTSRRIPGGDLARVRRQIGLWNRAPGGRPLARKYGGAGAGKSRRWQ